MIKQKEILVCDFCGDEIEGDAVTTHDVPNEGCSTIQYKKKSFDVGGQHYCDTMCLLEHLDKILGKTNLKPRQ